VVVGDSADLPSSASLVGNVALQFPMSGSIAEQTLIDAHAVACRIPVPFAPLALFIILFRAMFSPVCEVVEAGIKHGPWDIQGCRGIVENAWLEVAEGVGASQGA
jgi:hypothetical protein